MIPVFVAFVALVALVALVAFVAFVAVSALPVNAPTKDVEVMDPPLVILLLLRLMLVAPAEFPATSTCERVGVETTTGLAHTGARVVPAEVRICPAVPFAKRAVVFTADW